MADFWAWRPFSVGVKKHRKPMGDTRKVWKQATTLYDRSPLPEYDEVEFASDILVKTLEGAGYVHPSDHMVQSLLDVLSKFYFDEGLSRIEDDALGLRPDSRHAIATREYRRCQIRFLEHYDRNIGLLKKHLADICRYLMTRFPIDSLMTQNHDAFLTSSFIDIIEDVPEVVESLLGAAHDEDFMSYMSDVSVYETDLSLG